MLPLVGYKMRSYAIMRLKHIKLAGFKSFVDPTTVSFPSDLVAVVGPNGCGKSNVIDAVRWVMGESSAKQLRGDAMADVIFNGSNTRQPLAQASVELVFDNTDAGLGGEYASYSEIAVRRAVSLDGQSNYFLNGTRCRRRDITDIFLGTGLGARSYAIIKQDTVSRLIEAKPEELRVYLEEAAGISKYKERRRETETRIRQTRENLDRLEDLRVELEKQLIHLQRQRQAAERYQSYKVEEEQLKAETLVLHWQQLEVDLLREKSSITEDELAIEKYQTASRHVEAELESQRQIYIERQDEFNEVQSKYYQIGSDISRLEQSLANNRERREQVTADQNKMQQELTNLLGHQADDSEQVSNIESQLASLDPKMQTAANSLQKSEEDLEREEATLQAWQLVWDSLNLDLSQTRGQAEIKKNQLAHIEAQTKHNKEQLEKLQSDQQKSTMALASCDVQTLKDTIELQEQELKQQQEQQSHNQTQLQAARESNKVILQTIAKARTEEQTLRGQLASLDILQKAALKLDEENGDTWLEGHHLTKKPRLAQTLQVEPGWEIALEIVLGDYLQAICLEDDEMEGLTSALGDFSQGSLCLLQTQRQLQAIQNNTLLSKVDNPSLVAGLLAGVYVADDLAAALAIRQQLKDHESVVTSSGIFMGSGWLRISKEALETTGVLQREQEIASIKSQLKTLELKLEKLLAQELEAQTKALALEQARDTRQQAINQSSQILADTRSQWQLTKSKQQQLERSLAQLDEDMAELKHKLHSDEADYHQVRTEWQQALSSTDVLIEKQVLQQAKGEQCRLNLQTAKQQRQVFLDENYELRVQFNTLSQQLAVIQKNDVRLQQQVSNLQQHVAELSDYLVTSETPLQEIETDLKTQLQKRLEVAEKMNQVRQQLGGVDERISTLEQDKAEHEAAREQQKTQVESKRLAMQANVVRQATLVEQLETLGMQLEAVRANIPDNAEIKIWETKLEALVKRIQRLGAINLAAIEECDQLAERKQYLDKQAEDLQQALKTLEQAIHKIDTETRSRFKQTLDSVNQDFQALFPRVFSGGQAQLVLTEDNLLEAGVIVQARPPGKRNSSVHLLSGGEKALTAIALVFAIFQLNPAPFCMLDEVDAPLDDANILRFSQLVQEMSKKLQFIFITHNKVTMEMAQQLVGITMHEPGVSRLVSVDVEDAMALAEA